VVAGKSEESERSWKEKQIRENDVMFIGRGCQTHIAELFRNYKMDNGASQ
jgi:hypothetical protein